MPKPRYLRQLVLCWHRLSCPSYIYIYIRCRQRQWGCDGSERNDPIKRNGINMTYTAYAPCIVRKIKSRKIVYRKIYTVIPARFRFRVSCIYIYLCNMKPNPPLVCHYTFYDIAPKFTIYSSVDNSWNVFKLWLRRKHLSRPRTRWNCFWFMFLKFINLRYFSY